MADVHTAAVRSFNMSRIRSKDTKPELLARKFLHKNGFRYRLHVKNLPGKPDIVLPKYKTVILVQGCFWHGHPNCKLFKMPASRTEYWETKISKNIANDLKTENLLIAAGYHVLKIWECEVKQNFKSDTLAELFKGLFYLK